MTATMRRGVRDGAVLEGKYRLDGLLGAGGMGEVYRAVRVADGAAFAVKILRHEHCSDGILVERFLREARATDLVRHPNVVRVLDTGVDDGGTPFFVQELLIGEDLALCLKSCGGRLTYQIAIDLLLPIVEAMAVAHANGVVHRDLKPGNVFLARVDGNTTPKLLDFGISSLAASTEISRITSTGTSLGTPAYMSPEQVMGESDVDARSDVWSIGVMLYELVAGRLPFVKGETPGALFVQICTGKPTPLESIVADVPPDLARVVACCLRRRRGDRYATAVDLGADLRRVREGVPVQTPAMPPEQETMVADVGLGSEHALALGKRGSSEDVDTVAVEHGATARKARPTTASQGSMREIELDAPPAGPEASLRLASMPPPVASAGWRTSARLLPRPPRVPGATGGTQGNAAPFFAVAAAAAAAATVASPWRAGWPVLGALTDAVSFAPRAGFAGLAVVALAAGAILALRGVRRAPVAVGLLTAAIGFLGLAVALGVGGLLAGELGELTPRVVPWAAALVPAGLGMHGSRIAQGMWSSGRRPVAMVVVVQCACAFAIAAHLARAALM